jgi:DNA-binding LytR/AlgR family response regulator
VATEEALDPARFSHIHRSTFVSIDMIARVSRELCRRFIVKLRSRNERLPVNRHFVHHFLQMSRTTTEEAAVRAAMRRVASVITCHADR